jgi:hypothetical protein
MTNTTADITHNFHPFSQLLSRNWEKTMGKTLHWKQPKRFQSKYLLRSQDHNWGTLHYEGNHFVRRAIAKTSDCEWRFKYIRFSLPKITILKENEFFAQASLETNWGWQSDLILGNDQHFYWKPTYHTENEFCFLNHENLPVMFLRSRYGFFKLEADVEIDPSFSHNSYLPLLTMLGWFLMLLRHR